MTFEREKKKRHASSANYEDPSGYRAVGAVDAIAAVAAADVYLVVRAMGIQDGRASPIYSAQEPVRFSGRTRKRLAASGYTSRYLHLVPPSFLCFESRCIRRLKPVPY